MKKHTTLATASTITLLLALLIVFTACNKQAIETTETTSTVSTTFITSTTVGGLNFEELPIADETSEELSTTKAHYEKLEEIYNELGIEYITSFSEFEISDKTLIVSRTSGKIESIFPTNAFLDSHEFEFIGHNIERYVPKALENGSYAEGPIVAIFEEDLETRTAIRWTGELKIIVDGEYTIIIDPEN